MKRHLGVTAGEALWLWRRRLRYGTHNMARELQITEWQLYRMEHDTMAPPPELQMALPALEAGAFSAGEFAALCRRRAGMTMDAMAALTGVSRVTLWKQEHNKTATTIDLAQFWLHNFSTYVPWVRRKTVARIPIPYHEWSAS